MSTEHPMIPFLSSLLYRISFLASAFSAGYLHADNAIPRPLDQLAIYYPVATQIPGFSCGYNALFNAANFENWCGFPNPVHDFDIFKSRTMSFLAKRWQNPLDSSDNKLTEALATTVLHVQPLYHLTFSRENKHTIVLSGGVSVEYRKGISQAAIDRLLAEAHVQKIRDQFKDCKNYLASKKSSPAVLHFLCYVMSGVGKHIVLISLYQNSSGRALYLFDNLNEPLTMQHDTVRYLSFLSQEFNISDKKQFSAPSLPRTWQSLKSSRY